MEEKERKIVAIWCAGCNMKYDCAINYVEECTTETFLQSLQFKIIHRYFPCNYRLHLWNIVEDSKCTYCNIVDTLNHYFAECQVSRDFGSL